MKNDSRKDTMKDVLPAQQDSEDIPLSSMHVVHLLTELAPGGAEKIVLELSRQFRRRQIKVTVISLCPVDFHSFIPKALVREGVQILSLNLSKTTPWRALRLRQILLQIKPQIVHAHLIHPTLLARCVSASCRHQWKLLNTIHICERRSNKKWHFALDRWTQQFSDKSTAVSNAVRNYHAEKIGIAPDKIEMIYNGITLPQPLAREKITAYRHAWEMDQCARVIGSVGRLDWQKGYDILLKILAHWPAHQREQWGIVIVGEGPERKQLEKLSEMLPGNLRVCLPGFSEEAPDMIGAFDLFVMPSRYEGFGLALIEAMAHGIPVIANNIDSLPELLESYDQGQVMPFNEQNSSQIIEALQIWAKKGFAEPQSKFSADRMALEYLQLYQELLQ